jgi:CPA2 family monovalent cation:H+ antiporter-2
MAIAILLIFIASKHLSKQSSKMEQRFRDNLNEKEKYEESRQPVTKGFTNHLMQQDLHLSEFVILPHYSVVGKTLKELNFRQFFGVSIVTIARGEMRINIPKGGERIFPGDRIILLGTDEQMEVFQQRMDEKRKKYADYQSVKSGEVQMKQILIEPQSTLIGKTTRTSHIQDDYDCLLVGIERNNYSTQNPDLDLEFEEGDILWLIGEYANILKIREL